MKGDEGVEAREEGADGALLGKRRDAYLGVQDVLIVESLNRAALKFPVNLAIKYVQERVVQTVVVVEPYCVRILVISTFSLVDNCPANTTGGRDEWRPRLRIWILIPIALIQFI